MQHYSIITYAIPSLIFVFGGGGALWLDIYEKLAREAQDNLSGRNYWLLIPCVDRDQQGNLQRTGAGVNNTSPYLYNLYRNTAEEPQTFSDPGDLIRWYAHCDLTILRGGLALQQVLSLMLNRTDSLPQVLFIEEPGHAQIEHERRTFYEYGFVHSRTLADFRARAWEIFDEIMADAPKNLSSFVPLRYAKSGMSQLAKAIVTLYL